MADGGSTKVPTWFWVVSGLCLIWNLIGLMQFVASMMLTPEALAAKPEAERQLIEATPLWAQLCFALGTIAGSLGCVLLLLRKRLAMVVLVASLVGILLQMLHAFGLSNAIEVYGPSSTILPAMIVAIGVFLVWFTRHATARGWLR